MAHLKVGSLNHGFASFPAGYIIQLVSNSSAGNANSSSEYITYCTCGLTIKTTGSKILIFANPNFYLDTAGATNFLRLKYRTGSTSRSGTVSDYTDFTTNERWFGGTPQDKHSQGMALNLWTHGLSAGTQINIAISDVPSTGNSHNNNGTNARSEMTLMEVMQ